MDSDYIKYEKSGSAIKFDMGTRKMAECMKRAEQADRAFTFFLGMAIGLGIIYFPIAIAGVFGSNWIIILIRVLFFVCVFFMIGASRLKQKNLEEIIWQGKELMHDDE